jgi:hypothetical protein
MSRDICEARCIRANSDMEVMRCKITSQLFFQMNNRASFETKFKGHSANGSILVIMNYLKQIATNST